MPRRLVVRLRCLRNGEAVAGGAGPASHKRGKDWRRTNTVSQRLVTLPRGYGFWHRQPGKETCEGRQKKAHRSCRWAGVAILVKATRSAGEVERVVPIG